MTDPKTRRSNGVAIMDLRKDLKAGLDDLTSELEGLAEFLASLHRWEALQVKRRKLQRQLGLIAAEAEWRQRPWWRRMFRQRPEEPDAVLIAEVSLAPLLRQCRANRIAFEEDCGVPDPPPVGLIGRRSASDPGVEFAQRPTVHQKIRAAVAATLDRSPEPAGTAPGLPVRTDAE